MSHDASRTASRPVPSVALHHLSAETIAALAAGDRDTAERSSGLPITTFLEEERTLWVWQLVVAERLAPADRLSWLACAVIDRDLGAIVGHAGFHGPPEAGIVEIGYSIDPAYRRQGYGRAVVARLIEEAHACSAVEKVRASIDRMNTASFATIAGFGFEVVSERTVDAGVELVLERLMTR